MGRIIRDFVIIILCLAMVMGMVSSVYASENSMTMSKEGVNLLKQFEGFAEIPYWDYEQYSVGYGTRCPSDDYNRYCKYGITEKEAEILLRSYLKKFEKAVNDFAEKHHLQLSQNEFDALVSFTYNCGTGWMQNTDSLLVQAVIYREKGNDFIFALTQWCMAGGKIVNGLVERRLSEANVYLNGEYDRTVPANYKYVLFNWTDSDLWGEARTIRIQAYDTNLDAPILHEGVRDGYKFLGWYTLPVGGTWVTNLHDAILSNHTVYAHWQKLDATETVADYNRTVAYKTVAVKEPKLFAEEVREVHPDEIIAVIAEYVDADDRKWGKLEDGSWINLRLTRDTKMSDYKLVAQEKAADEKTILETENIQQETLWDKIIGFFKS